MTRSLWVGGQTLWKGFMYKYGMKERGFSIGCQPMRGLKDWQDAEGRYYSILSYDRELTEQEVNDYELEKIEGELYENSI